MLPCGRKSWPCRFYQGAHVRMELLNGLKRGNAARLARQSREMQDEVLLQCRVERGASCARADGNYSA